MTKIVVIGLDGATPSLIERWKEHLPNFRRIMENGVYGVLESTTPPETCPAWDCFSRGKNPGKLGVYGWLSFTRNMTPMIVDSTSFDSPAIWEILSQFGKRVGVLNVPITYPPVEVNGFMVSGMQTPLSRKDYTFPLELRQELDRTVNGYEIDVVSTSPKHMRGGEEEFLTELQRVHLKRLKATKYLMRRYPWDFFMVVFRALDVVQHHFWHYMDEKHPKYALKGTRKYGSAIRDWYVEMDETVGKIMKTIDDDTYLLIMSDHGFGPSHFCFYINEWLRKQGLLKMRKGKDMKDTDTSIDLYVKIKKLLFKHIGPGTIRKILKILPSSIILKGTSAFHNTALEKQTIDKILDEIEWSNTRAFALLNSGNIYINLKGRQPIGIVEPEKEYEELRNEIINKLRQIKSTETGEKVFIHVYKKEELYWGEHLDMAPDLVVKFFTNSLICPAYSRVGHGKLWGERDVSGVHSKEGVWMIIGPTVQENKKIRAKIIDLAPTILYLFDIPISMDMDGKVLRQAFSLTRDIRYQKISPITTKAREYSKAEEEELRNRLRGLGYL